MEPTSRPRPSLDLSVNISLTGHGLDASARQSILDGLDQQLLEFERALAASKETWMSTPPHAGEGFILEAGKENHPDFDRDCGGEGQRLGN